MPRAATGSRSPQALTLASGVPPWKQQPGETKQAYERFWVYCEKIDPLQRHRWHVVYDEIKKRDPEIESLDSLRNLATLHLWQIRAAAKDDYDRDEKDRLAQQAARRFADLHAERLYEAQIEHLKAGRTFVKTALAALEAKPLDEFTGAEIARLAELGVKMERQTLGLDHGSRADAGHPAHVDGLTDEQAAARLADLLADAARRMNTASPTASPTAAAAPDVVDAEVIPDGGSTHDPPVSRRAAGDEPSEPAPDRADWASPEQRPFPRIGPAGPP